jgi:hypothetical protein
MIKFNLDTNGLDKALQEELDSVVKTATADATRVAANRAREKAANQLNSSLEIWQKGFAFNDLGNGEFALTISGELARMFEDGIEVGEISKLVMQGNRAMVNKAEGKDYVDVPMAQQESSPAVKVFRSADDLIANVGKREVKFSDPKNKGVKVEERLLRRFKNDSKAVTKAGGIPGLIESKKTSNSKPLYLLIRRVTKDSNWPQQRVPGVEAFKEIEANLSNYFEEALRKLL